MYVNVMFNHWDRQTYTFEVTDETLLPQIEIGDRVEVNPRKGPTSAVVDSIVEERPAHLPPTQKLGHVSRIIEKAKREGGANA